MDKHLKIESKEDHIPIWLISLVILGVLGVFALLLVSFFSSSLA